MSNKSKVTDTRALAAVERQLAALDAASDFDPNEDFALKTEIGGIRGESARTKRLRRERWDAEARQRAALMERKQVLEARLAHAQAAPSKAAAVAKVEMVLRAMLRAGDQVVVAGFSGSATVMRLNAKSVSVRFASGYTERVEWAAVRPLEWGRMYAEWQTANPAPPDGGVPASDADPKSVACPTCGAKAGRWCRRPSGHSGPFVAFHAARRQAVETAQAEVVRK